MNVGYILLLLGLVELTFGLLLIIQRRKESTALWFGMFIISVAIYVIANGLGYLHLFINQSQAEHIAWTSGALIATFILPFSFSYPYPRKQFTELILLVIWPIIIFVPGVLWTNAFIQQKAIDNFGNGYISKTGVYFPLYMVFFIGYWAWALLNLFISINKSDGVQKRQLIIFCVGTALSLLLSSYFDLYKPLNDSTRFGYIGSLCTGLWFGFIGYIMLSKENKKLIKN